MEETITVTIKCNNGNSLQVHYHHGTARCVGCLVKYSTLKDADYTVVERISLEPCSPHAIWSSRVRYASGKEGLLLGLQNKGKFMDALREPKIQRMFHDADAVYVHTEAASSPDDMYRIVCFCGNCKKLELQVVKPGRYFAAAGYKPVRLPSVRRLHFFYEKGMTEDVRFCDALVCPELEQLELDAAPLTSRALRVFCWCGLQRLRLYSLPEECLRRVCAALKWNYTRLIEFLICRTQVPPDIRIPLQSTRLDIDFRNMELLDIFRILRSYPGKPDMVSLENINPAEGQDVSSFLTQFVAKCPDTGSLTIFYSDWLDISAYTELSRLWVANGKSRLSLFQFDDECPLCQTYLSQLSLPEGLFTKRCYMTSDSLGGMFYNIQSSLPQIPPPPKEAPPPEYSEIGDDTRIQLRQYSSMCELSLLFK